MVMNESVRDAFEDEKLRSCFSKDPDGTWWFREPIHNGWAQAIRVDDFISHEQTEFQTLDIFYNSRLGRVMLLDGAVQIVEKNWHAYQEMLACLAVLPQYSAAEQSMEVLIVGGGDGGVATILRKFFPDIKVTMVEIDKAVVEASKVFFPEISASLRETSDKFNLITDDGVKFVAQEAKKAKEAKEAKEANSGRFAAVIVDCTDPTDEGPAKGLFGTEFHENLKKCLIEGGIVLQQSGCLDLQQKEVEETFKIMRKLYQYPAVVKFDQLTYPGGMCFVGGSDGCNIRKMNKKILKERFSSFGLEKKAMYVTPGVLKGAFNMPQHFKSWLCQQAAQVSELFFRPRCRSR